jgi:hypothetical protein
MKTTTRIQEIKVSICGNYSNIEDKQERFLIESNEQYHIFKKGKTSRIKILTYNHNLFYTNISLYYNNSFIGNTSEIQGGFIPESNKINYFKERVYKTRKNAEDFLIHRHFESNRILFFGLLARQEFSFTKNYIENFSLIQLVDYMKSQFPKRATEKQLIKIAKKYRRAGVINYQGQGGFISKNENLISNF